MSPLPRIAIHGAAGRMGRALIQAIAASETVRLGAAIDRAGCSELGVDAGTLAGLPACGVSVSDRVEPALFDVLVDFTRPDAALAALDVCVQAGRAMVVGTTGLTAEQNRRIAEAARRIAICQAGNFSLGINLCVKLVREAARALGDGFDVEIVEVHHRHKVDAPSGTALMLGEAAAQGRGFDLRKHAVYAREGQTGARARDAIGFAAIRGGDVVGDHSALFLGEGERVEISHRATSRMNFAAGAVRAAAWVAGRPAGHYSMQDVLG